MKDYQRVANVEEIPPGTSAVVMVNNQKIAVFNLHGDFYAVDNTCPHSGGPLGQGRLAGPNVTCPWHGSKFDVRTGEVLAPPAPNNVTTYALKIEDNSIWIAAP